MVPLLRELSSKINVKIVFYLTDSFKEKIEEIGSNVEHRSCIRNKLFLDFEHDIGSGKNALACMLGFQLDAAMS